MALKEDVDKEITTWRRGYKAIYIPIQFACLDSSKKLDASGEKKYRMVIDCRKLNSVTIVDKYPIPEIGATLANPGTNKYFSIVNLKINHEGIKTNQKKLNRLSTLETSDCF